MGYNKADYARIKAEFSRKYLKAQENALQRRAEIYEQLPDVWELDRSLSRTGLDIMSVINEGVDVTSRLDAIRKRNDDITAVRKKILREHGFSEDYSDIKYECGLCGDTGFMGTKMCSCMKRALVMAGYRSSGLGELIKTQSFDNFSLEYYRTPDGRAYENMRTHVERLRSFACTFDDNTYQNYLFIGGTGLGKTHLSTAVAKEVIDRGHDVFYVTAVSMITDFEAKRFGNASEVKRDTERYSDADLLIIDDLGTEVTNQFTLSCIYDIINERINRRKSTFINTNLSLKDMETRYNERIISRLLGEYRPVMFAGSDVRRQKILRG